MINAIEIGKHLETLKVRSFVDVKNAIVKDGETMIEVFFPRYTDAEKAITFFKSKGIENTGRESNKNSNAYYKFKTEIYFHGETFIVNK